MVETRKYSISDDNSKYKDIDYWNSRYSQEESFEWCKSYCDFQHLIKDHISKSDKILLLGCGNSNLSENLYKDGYKNITNIDYSSVAIENASSKSQAQLMCWMVMDIRSLLFKPESFDVILEKATLDALLVDEKNPWKLSDEADSLLKNILIQISGLLSDGGKFISLTFAQPHFRKKILCQRRYNWSFKHYTYGCSFHYFFYVMTKGEPYVCIDENERESSEPQENSLIMTVVEYGEDIEYLNNISDGIFDVKI